MDQHWEKQAEWLARFEDLKRRRREAGLPETWRAAMEVVGWTLEEYDKAVEEAGLGFDTIL